MRISTCLPLVILSTLITTTIADVLFTKPLAGSWTTAGSLSIAWIESSTAPALGDLSSYELFLCAGGNTAASIVVLGTITTKGLFADGNAAIGTIQPGLGASKPENAYFLKMVSTLKAGGTVTNYSPRFTLSGMTGTFPDTVLTAMQTVTGTTGPARVLAAAAAAASVPAAADGVFDVPFGMQTGPIIYAPMMKMAPTKITKQNATPQNSKSAVAVATTYLPPNNAIQKTVTQGRNWSFTMRENPATPAAGPAGDMQRFLNRWKD